MGWKRRLADLDNRVLGRDWPTWSWLPAMTTLQALGVIVVAFVVAGLLPRFAVGVIDLDPGNGLVALSLAVAAFSPKRASKKRRSAKINKLRLLPVAASSSRNREEASLPVAKA